jgi:hypothetical protein
MPVETLTYAALGARLKVSPEAARSLAKRLGLPRSRTPDGKALVSHDVMGAWDKTTPTTKLAHPANSSVPQSFCRAAVDRCAA